MNIVKQTAGTALTLALIGRLDTTTSPELEKEIKDFCNSKLAEYKWIRSIEFVEEMPKTISGKIRKTEQRAKAAGKS